MIRVRVKGGTPDKTVDRKQGLQSQARQPMRPNKSETTTRGCRHQSKHPRLTNRVDEESVAEESVAEESVAEELLVDEEEINGT